MTPGAPLGRRSDGLSRQDLRLYLRLGAPALGLSLAATTLSAYLPLLARAFTRSRTAIGALVGCEGFVALLLPVWVGVASDRLGRRVPFLACTAPVAAGALVLLPFARSIVALVLEVCAFYIAYFTYCAPYRALYPDLVPVAQSGRAQGIQGALRGAGMGAALVGGALLLRVSRPLPYALAASALLVTTAALVLGIRREPPFTLASSSETLAQVGSLLRDHGDIRRVIAANVLWQMTEGGLKAFIVLFLTRGLGQSLAFAAGAMGVVAAAALVAAPVAGKLADRYGPVRVMRALLALFGAGLWLPAFVRRTGLLLAVLPVVGMGGAMALSLPYVLLMRAMPRESHGAAAGLFDVSSGAGSLLGPLVTGAAIDALHSVFPATHGYAAMWPAIGTTSLLSIALLRGASRDHCTESPVVEGISESGMTHDDRSNSMNSSAFS